MLVVGTHGHRYSDPLRDREKAGNVRGMAEPADRISCYRGSVFGVLVGIVDNGAIAARVHLHYRGHVVRCDGYLRRQGAHIPVSRAIAVREVVVNHVVDNRAFQGLGISRVAELEEERRITRPSDGVRTTQMAGWDRDSEAEAG